MSHKTTTDKGLMRDYELETVRDTICGLYGQDCKVIYSLDANNQAYFRKYLDALLEGFDAWREKYL